MASTWETVIGLEVHTELATTTKLFCGCPNRFGDEPNTNVCPVCLGLPGSLPVLNEQVVELAVRLGRALGCDVRRSVFARKNYFYPDMPKDYQVSQYDLPINAEGEIELPVGVPGGHRAGPPRGGHRQVDPRRRGRAHHRRRLQPRRLQPGRGAAARDRVATRHPLGRRGPRLRVRAAVDPRGHRRVRRQDGGGIAAGRRQRVGPPLRANRWARGARSRTSTRCGRSGAPSTTR